MTDALEMSCKKYKFLATPMARRPASGVATSDVQQQSENELTEIKRTRETTRRRLGYETIGCDTRRKTEKHRDRQTDGRTDGQNDRRK